MALSKVWLTANFHETGLLDNITLNFIKIQETDWCLILGYTVGDGWIDVVSM
jgi:hypothetical protein